MRQRILLMFAAMVMIASMGLYAAPTATVISQSMVPDFQYEDEDGDYRDLLKVAWSIEVKGASGHKLRLEYQLLDANGKKVYYDDDDPAFITRTYEVDDSPETITGWYGPFQDRLLLMPGSHKLHTTLKLFDMSTGEYIPLTGAKVMYASVVSHKVSKGIVVTYQSMEHNYWNNNAKGFKFNYNFEANWYKGKAIKAVLTVYKANGTKALTSKGKPVTYSVTYTPGYNFTTWSDRWITIPYSMISAPKGKTDFFAKITFYDEATGAILPTKGNNKINFWLTR